MYKHIFINIVIWQKVSNMWFDSVQVIWLVAFVEFQAWDVKGFFLEGIRRY